MKRGVRIVNKNNGHFMLAGLQETQTCLGKKEGTGLGEAFYRSPWRDQSLGCTPSLAKGPDQVWTREVM